MSRPLRQPGTALLLALTLLLTACTSGTNTTVAQGGVFELVTPGGKQEFSYPAAERKPLNEIAGPAIDDKGRISINDFAGQVIVLNFWGSWCAPCRAEAPHLATAARDLAGKKVQFIGINVRDNKQDAADFDAARKTPYRSIHDFEMRTLLSIRGFPVNSIPSTVVLDKQHRVAHVWLTDFSSPAPLVSVASALADES